MNHKIEDNECHIPCERGMDAMRMTHIINRHQSNNNRGWM
jgi:hypothetical protein